MNVIIANKYQALLSSLDIDVIKKAGKSKILERVLGVSIPNSIYEELENLIK